MKDVEVSKYLNKLNLNDCNNSWSDLKKLQQSHMVNIPFENLDVVAGRSINLDFENLFNKVINKGRGGYCFELNTLYAFLLKALGFSCRPVLGRVLLRDPIALPPRNHLAHLVEHNGDIYLTDVGFGGLTTRVPLNMYDASEINDTDGLVRIWPTEKNQFIVQRKVGDHWANQYSFENVKISKEDIEIANYYMSTNPNSNFYKHRFIGKFTNDGRIGLFNNQMSIRKGIEIMDEKHIAYGPDWRLD